MMNCSLLAWTIQVISNDLKISIVATHESLDGNLSSIIPQGEKLY